MPVETNMVLEKLCAAVELVQNAPQFASHARFDELTAGEWEQFNLHHAEVHQSFVVPQ